ncbi:restriction endonuclease subunit S [Listeria monocytogenes]|uniref:restriction endonuclease subunit S n=1 Tax=Listeria monocytogenes TaxID=1639 RepID=UPI00085C683E|nr:restriction endonuclease subunit S [Listeria monocytogenes]EAD7632556.1 restriction endonuclease subunit S [Listeria monocytogenes]EAG9489084.1 restriction endonuclease subunit S [Listeria monocytogenes]EGU0986572.1 restriction endonuclease subunit S [Listeria monocytogenes]OET95653.1 restriction endonuclease subunit S [Listeria monocytogenes]WIH39479.1 restriction endonuclease subunit S [Listeria monocytogenes]
MRNLEKSVPVIRFKGFSEAWEQRKLGDIANYRNGKAHEQVEDEDGKYTIINSKFISTNGKVQRYTNEQVEPIFDGEIAMVLSDLPNGKALAKLFLVKEDGKYTLNQRIAGITPNENIDPIFLNFRMNRNNYFLKFDSGVTQTNLSKSQVENFIALYPTFDEQYKIGLFFTQLDDTIALHQRKLDALKLMKKGFLQRMFPNNEEAIPKVRFADFDGMWKQRKLNSITEKITRKNKELESTLPLTISAQDGLIDQNEYFNKIIASRNIRGYFLVKNGEFAYNKSYSKGYPWGVVKRLDNYNMGVLSTLYIIFKPVKINSDFLTKYFDSTYWYRAVSQFATEGARNHGLLNIAASDFFEIELNIPLNNEEQKKIGLFFQQLENIIILHQNKLEKLSILKKTYLKKMFI